ncbi:MAG: PIN domain-containing protein [Bacteroidota bacterium]|nr:PIN domain-containing protein [Bacteroidota bacterium]
MPTRYSLQNVTRLKNQSVFVDANVLIYLFWPTGSYWQEQNYATVFRNLLKQGNNLFVDFLIISEVVNRILRIEHQKLNPTQKFKEFRNSQDGKDALADIYTIIKNDILNRFSVVGKAFNKQETENCLVVDELDFVDKAIVEVCKENSLVLLTHDKDFKDSDLDILTGNANILN